MNKKILIIVFAFATVCIGANAQPKEGGHCPSPIYSRDFSKMEVLDTTRLRVRYAFCAEKIDDPKTYIDLQRLDVGKRVVKYYSQFVYLSDSLVTLWWKENKGGSGPSWLGEGGREKGQWSEYEWSDYFFENGKLTEYCQMPLWLNKYNSWYTEPAPKQQWTLSLTPTPSPVGEGNYRREKDKDSSAYNQTPLPHGGGAGGEAVILGYKCQRATCRFRGRDFEAWFAPSIPVKRGPWKFQGLPGLILKVYDKDKLYTFEAIGLETRQYPITRFKQSKEYSRSTREKVWKMQRQWHENWFKAVDYHKATMDASGNMIPGEAVSIYTPYNPLELE